MPLLCPDSQIVLTPKSAAGKIPIVIAWGGIDAVKTSDTIKRLGVTKVIHLRNASTGLGADITPEYFR